MTKIRLTDEFRKKVAKAVIEAKVNYSGSDGAFAKSIGISNTAFSRLKKGETARLLADAVWLNLGRLHNVGEKTSTWNTANTSVYQYMESNLKFCKEYTKAMILVDECGIGKTFCSKHIVRGMKDAFYVDCSQGKTKQRFVRLLARSVGLESRGRIVDVKDNLKYYLSNHLDRPLIVLDDAGYLDYNAFLEIQELWNATEDRTGWYMIGDDSLQHKIEKGMNSKKIGYKAIFSRFSDEYMHISPSGKDDREKFMIELLSAVASANTKVKQNVSKLVKKCMTKQTHLRYLKTIIQVNG